ncbi:MAG: cytidylate kinase [Ignavibacteria bacterium RBG_16_34_14]|nr:MAG: cytidylate kinase [Ignavibacteria bacterium RBG_16_34_14]
MPQKLVVAIDGPAGSGKSTSAILVAQKLGYLYIDTGAMYRAITFLAIKKNLHNEEEILRLAERTDLKLDFIEGKTKVFADKKEITEDIRMPEVNAYVSEISKIENVRKILVQKQREMGSGERGVVMEGRDIGTVVFPNADVKIFMTASVDERAKRRKKEYSEKGINITLEEVKKNLLSRDEIDSGREFSPLTIAGGAIEVNTSEVSIEEQVNIILEEVKKAANKKGILLRVN